MEAPGAGRFLVGTQSGMVDTPQCIRHPLPQSLIGGVAVEAGPRRRARQVRKLLGMGGQDCVGVGLEQGRQRAHGVRVCHCSSMAGCCLWMMIKLSHYLCAGDKRQKRTYDKAQARWRMISLRAVTRLQPAAHRRHERAGMPAQQQGVAGAGINQGPVRHLGSRWEETLGCTTSSNATPRAHPPPTCRRVHGHPSVAETLTSAACGLYLSSCWRQRKSPGPAASNEQAVLRHCQAARASSRAMGAARDSSIAGLWSEDTMWR